MTRENRSSDSDDEIHIPMEVMGSSSSHDDSLDHSATSPLTKSASFLADEEALENDSAMAARWKRIKGSWWFRKTRKWGPLALTTFIVVLVDIIAGVTIWSELTWEGWVAVADVSLLLILLVNDVFEPHFTMVLGMTIMLIFEIITEAEALKGFSSSGVAQIAVLFVVSKGVQLSGALKYILRYILRNPKLLLVAHLRLLILVSSISAFMNNTPIVTVMTPVVQSWCRTTSFSTSRLLMPLSFAVILGGLCTLIGTSTNLVVLGLVEEKYPGVDVGFFEVGYVGLPVLVVGLIYMMVFCYCLLPIRAVGAESFTSDPREYSAGVRVDKKSRIVGKTIEKAGLRHLPNVYLFEIQRGEEIIPAPAPTTVLNANDILYFSGVINSMQAVYEVDGLSPVGDEQVRKIANLEKHLLVEAVIASHSPIVGRTVKECEFRTRYNAAIISVHRAGERIKENIGDIEFKTGDTLLLETTAQFVEYNKNNSHFALVSRVEGLDTVLPKQDVLNMLFVVIPAIAMIVCSIFELTTLTGAALVVACLYIITGRLTVSQAMNAVKPDLLIIIAAGFAVGSGLTNSGAAAIVGDSLLPFFRVFGGNFGVLLGLYVMTGILTSFITNSAAVTLVFPIAVQIINESGLNVKAVTFALMMAASSSFATPVGYQTNIIVWGPGGYTSADFFRFGFPLVIISGIITVPLCFMFWPTGSGTV